jgi:hypothetical protein
LAFFFVLRWVIAVATCEAVDRQVVVLAAPMASSRPGCAWGPGAEILNFLAPTVKTVLHYKASLITASNDKKVEVFLLRSLKIYSR